MKRLYLFIALIAIPFFGTSQTLEELNKPIVSGLDEVTTCNEGLTAVRKGNQWGFIDKTGTLIIDFRDDLLWNKEADTNILGVGGIGCPEFKEGLCIVKALNEEGIARYGFMDITGKIVIEPEFLNVTQFDNGRAVGIFERKSLRGKNPFQLKIYDYAFTEVVVNKKGEMVWPIQERHNIVMSKRLYELPELHAKIVSENLLAVKGKENKWKVVQLELK
ncbi:WG repeat-containing protein [Maribacter sp. ACAM166]|uniref:WG repeat-containing protein n=1 Tax=Maribacter sp. ACAM166 TaxID=2508996 RepID=UPI0010FEB935|nr:WG repeat-containing protein [Maribacter sp. ACAM166]TLP81778.1 WG repeat-containing protein [Maribacter sp. ACAM166]